MKHRQTIHIRFSDGTSAQISATTSKRIAFVSLDGWSEGYSQHQLDEASKAWEGLDNPDAWLEEVRGTDPKVKQGQITDRHLTP